MDLKIFVLDDLSEWTCQSASEKIGCSMSCARQRLLASTDPASIFREFIGGDALGSKYKKREYTLTQGDEECFTGTAKDIAHKWSLCESTVYHRLRSGNRSVKIICKPANNSQATTSKRATPPAKPSELIKSRMLYNTEFDWALLMRAS